VQYTGIIDAILATADLKTITRKRVREGLEKALGGKDLGHQKVSCSSRLAGLVDVPPRPRPRF
jgi:hypothetical protein